MTAIPRVQPSATAPTSSTLAGLQLAATSHRAVHHRWLNDFQTGSLFADPSAISDFAGSYARYSTSFPAFLRAVIDSLESPEHRELLGHNLREEGGELDDEMREELREAGIDPVKVDGVSHPKLFRRFHDAVNGQSADPRALRIGEQWRDAFLELLRTASAPAAVGALGIGTEGIVRDVYQQILGGLENHTTLEADDYIFFTLHCLVDDQHQLDLLSIAADLSADEEGKRELTRGALAALDLRARYWDRMHELAVEKRCALLSAGPVLVHGATA